MKLCIFLLLSLFVNTVSYAQPAMGGGVEAQHNGEKLNFPLLKSDFNIEIDGDLATITLKQTFKNPADVPLHARYIFPLNADAAVYRMQLSLGNEIVEAVIQKKQKAHQIFNQAKRKGKTASLLSQHRPNVFIQKIANLMPGVPVEVNISYVQTVKKLDGAYELVIPLVVGPRYQPPNTQEPQDTYPQIIPDHIAHDRVSVNVDIRSPVFISNITSSTHPIKVSPLDAYHQKISLHEGKTLDNKDFVLRYQLSGRSLQAATLTTWSEDNGYFSLLIEPPEFTLSGDVLSREMVFVLDCSGSMAGLPLNASKTFMRKALANLRPTDTFRIIRFSDRPTEFSTTPQPATAENIAAGIQYTNALVGSGGTMMSSGVMQALNVAQAQTVRNVIFLTDGYIGNDFEILNLIERHVADARLFAFGVGTGVNRFLLDEMSRIGRGFTRYFDPTDNPTTNIDQIATELAERLQTPLLTNIEINWLDTPVTGVTPGKIPDLYQGDSIRIQGRVTEPGSYALELSGDTPNSLFTKNLTLEISTDAVQSAAIPLIWARSRIKEHMHTYITPQPRREDKVSNEWIKQQVSALGLQHALVTKWTSFVAVSRFISNPNPQETLSSNVPLHQVKGVSEAAYHGASFGGYAAPEPELFISFFLVLLLCFAYFKFNRRSPS